MHKKKKKKRTGASAFIDDIAEEEDGGDDEDDEDDGDVEEDLDEGEREAVELEAQQRIHARYQNMENMERMENEEEIEKQIKERYAAHLAGFDGDVVGSAVDQQALHPTVQDPKLWLVTVKQGKERETVVCLMQKAINMHKTGKGAVAIKSACVQDHLKSYIYVEAERESDVKKALTGMRHVYHSKPIKLVPINEMVDSITVTKKKVENIQYQSWVRMRGGVYKGDLARVIDINYADNQCSVQLVPRFDYALLQAKEEGTAAGRAKPNAALRPPARLFTEAEARKYNLSLERGRMDRRTGDRLDILCGVHKLRDGYFIKTISLASCKLAGEPPLDELQRYTAGEDAAGEDRAEGGAGKSMTEANLEALAASLGDRSAGADQVFRTGDQVVIIKGDLKNLTGIVDRVLGDGTVKIKPEHELLHDVLDVDKENLRKSFKIGSHVRCIQGRHEGEAGLVVKVEGEVATVFSDVTKEEFLVFSHHLADSAETTHRVETLGEYGVHDLALLKDDSVGMLIRVEKDAAMLMMSTSNFDRPDVRAVRLHDFQRKLQTRTLTAVDSAMETIESKSMCRIVDGPGKGTTITVEHIWKGTLWGKARGVSEHGGMLVCRSRDVKIHGGRAKDPVTGGKGFGAVPMSPGSALLRSPSRQDTGGPQAAPQRGRFGGGAVGRRDAGLIGSGVKVTAGVYKGYKGKVVDATETTVRVELQAQGRTVTVQRTQITQPGAAPAATSTYGGAPSASVDSFQPPARTPQHRPTTPAYNPGMTPSRDDGAGGRTPLRDTAWGSQTPAYDTSHWNDDTPTPGGESGYTGTPDIRVTGTPDLRGGSSALAISASDAGYHGKFITGAVVVLPGGKQGVVRSRAGDEVTVQVGTLKTMANGETRMESVEGDEKETIAEAELELAKPQKKDKVIVVEGTDRGQGAELIGVDNEDGVIKMDATKEISIYGIGTLARIFVG